MMPADLLERVLTELDAQLAALQPAVAEYEQLLGAADVLEAEQRASMRGGRYAGAAKPAGASSTAKDAPEARAEPAARAKKAKPKAKTASVKRTARSGGRGRPAVDAAQQAIVAALEHGSHTVSELVLVTAMSGADIRESIRRLLKAGTVMRARREGRVAYALSDMA